MPANRAYGAVRRDVPHNLRQLRQERGLSIADLATALNLETTTVQRYETQPQRLRVYQLRELAEVLQCSVVELVDDGSLGGMRQLSENDEAALDALHAMTPEKQKRALTILQTLAGSGQKSGAA